MPHDKSTSYAADISLKLNPHFYSLFMQRLAFTIDSYEDKQELSFLRVFAYSLTFRDSFILHNGNVY